MTNETPFTYAKLQEVLNMPHRLTLAESAQYILDNHALDPAHREIIREQDALIRQMQESMAYAIWLYEGHGSPLHNHWTAKAREALTAAQAAGYTDKEG